MLDEERSFLFTYTTPPFFPWSFLFSFFVCVYPSDMIPSGTIAFHFHGFGNGSFGPLPWCLGVG